MKAILACEADRVQPFYGCDFYRLALGRGVLDFMFDDTSRRGQQVVLPEAG